MIILKDLVNKILLDHPECRDSDKKLIWEVWKQLGLIGYENIHGEIDYDSFMSAPSNESVRRVRQQLQRSDLLTGAKLIQPNPKVKKQRQILANEKGYEFIQGKRPVFNEEKQCYEI